MESSNVGTITFVILGVIIAVGAVIGLLKLKKTKQANYEQAQQIDREMVDMKRNNDVEASTVKEPITETTPLKTGNGNCVEEIKYENEKDDHSENSKTEKAKDEIKYIDDQDENLNM